MKSRSRLTMIRATLVLCIPTLCQAAQPADTSHPILIGERFQLYSQAIGETRSYFVHFPEDYGLSNDRYPLLIVLDGAGDFQHASTTADLLADAGRIPRMLVVGIPNTLRNRDMIPFAAGSGSENFLKFLTTELIPKLDHDLRTQPHRILVGHSFGGLFGLYALIKAPEVFKGYIIASATLEGDNRGLARTVGTFLEAHKDLAANVYLTMANEPGEFLSGNYEMSAYMQNEASRDSHFTFVFRRYPEETHGTVPLRASMMDWRSFSMAGLARIRVQIPSLCTSMAALPPSKNTMPMPRRGSDIPSRFPKTCLSTGFSVVPPEARRRIGASDIAHAGAASELCQCPAHGRQGVLRPGRQGEGHTISDESAAARAKKPCYRRGLCGPGPGSAESAPSGGAVCRRSGEVRRVLWIVSARDTDRATRS